MYAFEVMKNQNMKYRVQHERLCMHFGCVRFNIKRPQRQSLQLRTRDSRKYVCEKQNGNNERQQPKATYYLYIHNHCDTFFIFISVIVGIFSRTTICDSRMKSCFSQRMSKTKIGLLMICITNKLIFPFHQNTSLPRAASFKLSNKLHCIQCCCNNFWQI